MFPYFPDILLNEKLMKLINVEIFFWVLMNFSYSFSRMHNFEELIMVTEDYHESGSLFTVKFDRVFKLVFYYCFLLCPELNKNHPHA